MKNDKTILDMIIDGVNIIRAKNRNIEEIVLGAGSLTELQMNTIDMIFCEEKVTKTSRMKLLGYPIKTLSFLPHNYIGLKTGKEF